MADFLSGLLGGNASAGSANATNAVSGGGGFDPIALAAGATSAGVKLLQNFVSVRGFESDVNEKIGEILQLNPFKQDPEYLLRKAQEFRQQIPIAQQVANSGKPAQRARGAAFVKAYTYLAQEFETEGNKLYQAQQAYGIKQPGNTALVAGAQSTNWIVIAVVVVIAAILIKKLM